MNAKMQDQAPILDCDHPSLTVKTDSLAKDMTKGTEDTNTNKPSTRAKAGESEDLVSTLISSLSFPVMLHLALRALRYIDRNYEAAVFDNGQHTYYVKLLVRLVALAAVVTALKWGSFQTKRGCIGIAFVVAAFVLMLLSYAAAKR